MRDYSNNLEKIIENKEFEANTKNLLLSMFYKVETAHEDFSKVKVDTAPKRETLEEILDIIEHDCDHIELTPATGTKEEIEKDRDALDKKREKRLISYPSERDLLYAIYNARRYKFEVSKEHMTIRKSLAYILGRGSNIDASEIIRDFDGWSWNTLALEKEEVWINLLYQNMRIMLRKWLFGNVDDE